MRVETRDYNGFEGASDPELVRQITDVVRATPLYVKRSAQRGKGGTLIFDPPSTNEHMVRALAELGWIPKVPIPDAHQVLGLDVDFGRAGHLVEVQFSTYPYFLNNVIRTDILFRNGTRLSGMGSIKAAIIVAKAKILPSSNGVLYFEQAVGQADYLSQQNTVIVPFRIVGMFLDAGDTETAILSHPKAQRARNTKDNEKIRVEVRATGRAGDIAELIAL